MKFVRMFYDVVTLYLFTSICILYNKGLWIVSEFALLYFDWLKFSYIAR